MAGLPPAPAGRRGARLRQRRGALGRRRPLHPGRGAREGHASAPSRWSGPRWCTPRTDAGGSTSAARRRARSTGGWTCWRPTPSPVSRPPRPRTVLPGSATTAVKDPVIRHDGGQWHLWASVHPLDDPDATDRMTTEHATSPDGIDWTWRRTALRRHRGQLGRPGRPLRHRRPRRLPLLGALRRPGDRGGELGGAHRAGRRRRGPVHRGRRRTAAPEPAPTFRAALLRRRPGARRWGPLVLRGHPGRRRPRAAHRPAARLRRPAVCQCLDPWSASCRSSPTSPTGTSATPPPCSRSSASASRSGRCTPCSSPTTPATASGPGGSSTARPSRRSSQGIAARGVLGRCDAVLSGYLGSADIGHAVVATVGQVRAANPDAVYCCDPVIGDVGRGVFVRPGIEEFLREVAVPAADIVTPNHFELDLLSGTDHHLAAGGQGRRRRGPGPRAPGGADDVAGHRRHPGRRRRPARLGGRAALPGAHARGWGSRSTGRVTRSRRCSSRTGWTPAPPARRSGGPTASVFGLLQRTEDAGSREILLVEAQEEFVAPTRTFAVDEV